MSKDDVMTDISTLVNRAQGIRQWLTENGGECFEEQEHVHAGTKGKIYWHYGYMAALIDMLRYLTGVEPRIGTSSVDDSDGPHSEGER